MSGSGCSNEAHIPVIEQNYIGSFNVDSTCGCDSWSEGWEFLKDGLLVMYYESNHVFIGDSGFGKAIGKFYVLQSEREDLFARLAGMDCDGPCPGPKSTIEEINTREELIKIARYKSRKV